MACVLYDLLIPSREMNDLVRAFIDRGRLLVCLSKYCTSISLSLSLTLSLFPLHAIPSGIVNISPTSEIVVMDELTAE